MKTGPMQLTGLRVLAAALWALTIPAAAQVDAPPPPPGGRGLERMCADQEARLAARLAFLETKLSLKPEQRSEWQTFAAALRAAEEPLHDLCERPPAPSRPGDPVAALETRDRIGRAHATVLLATQAAVAHLRDKLDPDRQRRLAEALLSVPEGAGPHLPHLGPPPPLAPDRAALPPPRH